MATSGVYPIWGTAALDTICTVRRFLGGCAVVLASGSLAGCGSTAPVASMRTASRAQKERPQNHAGAAAVKRIAPCLEADRALEAWASTVKSVGERYTLARTWTPFIEKALALEDRLRKLSGTEQAIAAVSRQREVAAALEAEDAVYRRGNLRALEVIDEDMKALLAAQDDYPPKQLIAVIEAGCKP